MQLEEEDIWEAPLLESTEEALLFGEDSEPQEAETSTPYIPVLPIEALKPKVAARVVGPLDIQ